MTETVVYFCVLLLYMSIQHVTVLINHVLDSICMIPCTAWFSRMLFGRMCAPVSHKYDYVAVIKFHEARVEVLCICRYGFPEMMQSLFKEGGVYSMPDEELKAVEKSCHKRSADLFKVGGWFKFSPMLPRLALEASIIVHMQVLPLNCTAVMRSIALFKRVVSLTLL